MIIDCDTHFLPPDAYDYLGAEWEGQRPRFGWDVEWLEKRSDIGARDKELIRSGNALRLLGRA